MDLTEIDLGLLIALEALARERNVTHAAAKLGISQSALSTRLNRLRQAFGDQLFVPAVSGRGVVPTPRAAELQLELADVLGKLRRIVEGPASFVPAQTRRTFVVAIYENPGAILAPGLTSRVRAAAPDARLAFVHPSSDVVDRLERGEIDLLVAGPDKTSADLIRRPLFEDDFVTAQRRGHPRGTGTFDLDTFCSMTHLLVSADGGAFSGLVDDALAAMGRTRRVMISIQNYALAPMILANSDHICTLPRRFLMRFDSQLDFALPPLELPRPQLIAFWHLRNQEDSGHMWLRECLYQVATASEPCIGSDEDRLWGRAPRR